MATWRIGVALAARGAGALAGGDFLVGVDVSHLKFFEDRGVEYRDAEAGRDALELLRDRGIHCVRLRLFTSSAAQAQADPYNRTNNLDYTLPLAQRVKRAGLKLLLNLHYSDTWADPGKQSKPAAWTNLTFADLEGRVREYTSNCLAAFRTAGAAPDYVQVGNEIIGGFLWPEGRVGGTDDTPDQWRQLGRLLQAAIGGIREASGPEPPPVMLHIDRGADWGATQWFFDGLRAQGVAFDLIGQSYYPFWHGTLEALQDCLERTARRYGKPVFVVETAFPWTNSPPVLGLPATPDGQARFVAELGRVVRGVPGALGAGVFWWGTEYQRVDGVATAGFEYRSLFDTVGTVLPAASALGQLNAPVVLRTHPAAGTLRLSWPLSGAGLSLTTATSLSPPVTWAMSAVTQEQTGWMVEALVPSTDAPSRFYRLESR